MKNIMRKKILTFVLVFGMATFVGADDASKTQKIEELLSVTKTDVQMDKMLDRMQKVTQQRLEAQNFPEALEAKLAKIANKELDLIKEELSWDYLKSDYIALYMEMFTEDEIIQLTEFYQTDLGQKLQEKTPELFSKGMLIGQKKMGEKRVEIQKIMKSELEEFEASLTDEERELLQVQQPAAGNGL